MVEALSEPAPVRAAMGAGWERVSQGMVETETGPLLLVDVAALIAGAAEAKARLRSSLPLTFSSTRTLEAGSSRHEELFDRR